MFSGIVIGLPGIVVSLCLLPLTAEIKEWYNERIRK